MRYSSKPTTAAGTLRVSVFGLRQTIVLIAVGLALMWAAVAFAQEAYLSHKLQEQVSDLRRQNAEIAAQNAGYRKDVAALTNGTGDEEEARLNGFARPNERIFLVTTPSPSPPPRSR
jgi:cell division protein FtsB